MYQFPTAVEMRQIEQEKLPVLEAERPIFQWFPIEVSDTPILLWEQKDNFTGLQNVRGLDGAPRRVKQVGGKQFQMIPGTYGDFKTLSETEMTMRRQFGNFSGSIDIGDLVMEAQDHLLQRRYDRIEATLWSLCVTGTFSVLTEDGSVAHTDTFTIQTFTAGTAWSTIATATPIANFRSISTLGRGKGVSFGQRATALMNQVTFNNMLANTNANDLFGKRTALGSTYNDITNINMLLAAEGLPKIVIYEGEYLNDAGAVQMFIPDGKVVVFGQRPSDARIGTYRYTRNVNNPGMAPGPYQKVIYRENQVPMTVEVHDGHNGGPIIWYPSSVLVMNV